MSTPAHDLALHLESAGLGVFGADTRWSIAVAHQPAAPEDTITLYDTTSEAPEVYDDAKRWHGLQVRARAVSYPDAYAKQDEVFAALNAIKNQTINGAYYSGVWMSTDINGIGRDESDRYILTANYDLSREV